MDIESLKPKSKNRVMDLLLSLDMDVSDWANFKGGQARAASNPRYCYEWCFEDPEKQLIVLCTWFKDIESDSGKMVQRLNFRDPKGNNAGTIRQSRARNMERAVIKAFELGWPVHAIICDGPMRDVDAKRSRANRRELDIEVWHVESFNDVNGDCVLVRGPQPKFVDQFELTALTEQAPSQKLTTTTVYDRDPAVRRYVLKRANGCCEYCGEIGFVTASGSIYLESHHIQPLSEGGVDGIENVIALCPNHHREAHYGEQPDQFRQKLMALIA